jgi:hypothetical protein
MNLEGGSMRTQSELVALAAVLSVLSIAAAASPSNASANPSQVIKFALAFHDVQVDVGKNGPSVGDERIFTSSARTGRSGSGAGSRRD